MDKKKFDLWNRIVALAVFLVAAVTYLLTIEPTASFWDCGEFIASSYKLEVGHPPGNPVFQLFARFATMFTGPEHAAVAVNAMNAILSALTILLLYLTTVFLVKRLVKAKADGTYSLAKSIAIFGSGAVGALAYTFSDTFWFSAVEGEVYAMSSLFTALVFWAMTKWYEQADEPYANRWLVLIAFLMGLSIGIHLLNLLTIPALVFLFFYRKRETLPYTPLQQLGIFGVSVVILAFILYGVIPYLPQLAAVFDRFFVNTLGMPFNVGAAVFMLGLLGLCFYGLFYTMKTKKVLWNTVLLCLTMIIIGFSLFTIVIIRSSVKTPTNEYQPDNPYTLIRYLGREQYGSNPLIYGQAFESPYDFEDKTYWAPSNLASDLEENKSDEYVEVPAPAEPKYHSEGKMFFPRMWSSDDNHKKFYMTYVKNPKHKTYVHKDSQGRESVRSYIMPSFLDNLSYFFDYQINWMYLRYFMWNFAGRQNDVHGQEPNQFNGNWECGIDFIDHARLGDQSNAPVPLRDNKGKNHYYMLPLLLGLIGIFFQYARDKRGCWVTFLMFFMTGIAIVVYLNQPPYQARERDYAYAGSFYTFSIWIGIAVVALYTWTKQLFKAVGRLPFFGRHAVAIASVITGLALFVPTLMAVENWDDHDRSNRYTAVEMAKNYLNSVGENGILITHGDNDTFPLWYAQEVEGVRTDVRVVNTSLLGTDWHINQMKWATNDSAPLDLNLHNRQYLYGTNEFLYVDPYQEHQDDVIPLATMMDKLRKGKYRLDLGDEVVDYIPYRNFSIPVDRENVIRSGILSEKYADQIPDEIVLSIPQGRQYVIKPELFMLDLLANYKWDRPINMLSMGGDINIGVKDYLMYEGFSYKFVPIKNRMSGFDVGFSDPYDLYYKMKNVYKWDALKRTDYFVDYQNNHTFCGVLSQRQIFVNAAKELAEVEEYDKAIEMLDMCMECVPEKNFPLDMSYLGFNNEYWVTDIIVMYFTLGEREKAMDILDRFMQQLMDSKAFYAEYASAEGQYKSVNKYIEYIIGFCQEEVNDLIQKSETDPAARDEATNLVRMYLRWMSLTDWPTDPMWNILLKQAHEVGKEDKVEGIINPYADNLIFYMNLYETKRAELLAKQEKLGKEIKKIEEDFYEVYYRYQSLYEEVEKNPHNSRLVNQFERAQMECENYEQKYGQKKSELDKCESSIEDMEEMFWMVIDEMRNLDLFARQWYDNTYAPEKIRKAFYEYWGEEAETLLFK